MGRWHRFGRVPELGAKIEHVAILGRAVRYRDMKQLSPRGWVKVPTGGDDEPGAQRNARRQPGADQVQFLGRRSESGWERVRRRRSRGRRALRSRRVPARRRRRAPWGPTREGPCATTRRWTRRSASPAPRRRRTAPSPWVGCVLVRDGEVVGEGATEPPGRAARRGRRAAARAGTRAAGATAYVHARTVLAPRPHAAVRRRADRRRRRARRRRARRSRRARSPAAGIARLRDAGIDVDRRCRRRPRPQRDLAPYLHHRRTGRPFVVAKVATSLDGRVAAADGTSQWITSDAARADAHELRADSQAIVVGAGTALADQPALDRPRRRDAAGTHPPLRVAARRAGVVSRRPGRCSTPTLAPTLVITTTAAPPPRSTRGARPAPRSRSSRPRPDGRASTSTTTFALLGREGVLQVLVEGRRHAARRGRRRRPRAAARRLRRAARCSAPTASPAFASPGPRRIDDARRYRPRRRAAARPRRPPRLRAVADV